MVHLCCKQDGKEVIADVLQQEVSREQQVPSGTQIPWVEHQVQAWIDWHVLMKRISYYSMYYYIIN